MTEDEGDIHCHGLAWSSDPNDVSSVFKFNAFFYVSLYDHWYKRGYVENSLDGDFNETGIPMCGCVDEMPMVTRADCTQVTLAEITFSIEWEQESGLTIEAGPLVSVELDECQGHLFGNPGRSESNDLASHMNALVANDQMTVQMKAKNFDTLVGFGQPNRNDNAEACALGLVRHSGYVETNETSTSTSTVEYAKTGDTGKRGPTWPIVTSVLLCVVVVAGAIMAARSERVRNLLSGSDDVPPARHEASVDESS